MLLNGHIPHKWLTVDVDQVNDVYANLYRDGAVLFNAHLTPGGEG